MNTKHILEMYHSSFDGRYADDCVITFVQRLLSEVGVDLNIMPNKNEVNVRSNNRHVKLVKVFFRGGEFPGYIYNGVIYENRDDEPIHWAIKEWEEISTKQHALLCERWKI